MLLDALGALREQLDAVVLVGAQAIYLHAGEGDLAVAPYTTDGDLSGAIVHGLDAFGSWHSVPRFLTPSD